MIQKLDNTTDKIAIQIFTVFQNSYKVEAQLIGTQEFPPLTRGIKNIKESKTLFYGFIENGNLAAVIEINIKAKRLEIDSLTVDPIYFRKGIAGKLINFVLTTFEFSEAIVETAIMNEPAIKLYNKYGFIEFKRWVPSHGIPKLALSLSNAL